jgi:hypothetical protein
VKAYRLARYSAVGQPWLNAAAMFGGFFQWLRCDLSDHPGGVMARKYSQAASKKVEKSMHELKRGTLKSGRSGSKVKSRKQAIAIGLSEARRAGKKVPKKRSAAARRSR